MKLTEKEFIEILEFAKKHELKGWQYIERAGYELTCKICNGIGAEWMPSIIRKALDKLNPALKVVAIIHDLGYFFGSGSIYNFCDLNDEFRINAYIVADIKKWYDPRRYAIKFQGWKFSRICDHYGLEAYKSAIKQRKSMVGDGEYNP